MAEVGFYGSMAPYSSHILSGLSCGPGSRLKGACWLLELVSSSSV